MHKLIDALSRKKNSGNIIHPIDGLRALAVMAVLCSHFNLHLSRTLGYDDTFIYSNPVSRFLELSGYGVNIFFCISGFMLVMPFAKHYLLNHDPVSLKKYYLRRFVRIEPPYLIVLTAFFVFLVLFMQQSFREQLPHYISSVFYSHNLVYGRRSTINPVAWTLEIEIQFYMLLPLLAKLFTIRNLTIRRLVFICLIALGGFLYASYDAFFEQYHLQYSIIAYLPVFVMGFLLADIYIYHHHLFIRSSFLWDIFAIVGFLSILFCSGSVLYYEQWMEYGGYFLLFAGTFRGKILPLIFTKKWVMVIGTMCYSIYLLHYALVYLILNNLTAQWLLHNYYQDVLLQGILVIPSVLIISALFYWFVEKPFINK